MEDIYDKLAEKLGGRENMESRLLEFERLERRWI